MRAITYIGKTPVYKAKIGQSLYEFEWQKSVGIGNRNGEVRPEDASLLRKKRDSRGKKIFILDE